MAELNEYLLMRTGSKMQPAIGTQLDSTLQQLILNHMTIYNMHTQISFMATNDLCVYTPLAAVLTGKYKPLFHNSSIQISFISLTWAPL